MGMENLACNCKPELTEQEAAQILGTGDSEIELSIRKLIEGAGREGIGVREFYEHPDLAPYFHEDVERALQD
ncbi:MAG: hypothetical protein Q4F02_00370 [Candidatus Saccharibacteria bacterium]|nr:hypothetical protein [Candidatus Saccharibacteria bacterium]